MTTMTDARAVEVLAAMRDDGGAVADADYTAAIDHAIARMGEPAEAQPAPSFAEWLATEMPAGTVIGDPAWWANRIARQYAKRRSLAQAQGAGEVVPIAWRTVYPDGSHGAWKNGAGHWPETKGFAGGAHGWEYAFAPPSAPVGAAEDMVLDAIERRESSAPMGVDLDKVAAHLAEHGGDFDALIRLVKDASIAQQPAPVAPVGVEEIEAVLHGVYMDHQDYRLTKTMIHDMATAVVQSITQQPAADDVWAQHPQTVESKRQWDAVAKALGADPDCPDAVLAAAQAKPASAWQAIVEACVITEAVTPDATDPRGTLHRLIDYHVGLDRDQQPAAVDGAMVERACVAAAECADAEWPVDYADDDLSECRTVMRAALTAAHATAAKDAEIEALRERLDSPPHAYLRGKHVGTPHDDCLLCDSIAEREALRAEVNAAIQTAWQQSQFREQAQARAERLAEALRAGADALDRLAFEIPAPNEHTPRLAELAIHMRRAALNPTAAQGDESASA